VDADTARAIAVAENNEELSMKLNGIELARLFQDLRDKDWTVPKISNLTGVHERRVQRCLELLDAPQEVQDAVSAGKIAESVAREVASASDNVRGAILNALEHSPNMSAMDIRKLAKSQEKALHAAETGGSAPDPEGETEGGKGANRPAAHAATPDLVTWRGHRELQGVLVQACSTLCAPEEPSEDGKAKTAEEESEDAMARAHLLGVAAAMLFARDDIKTPWPPAPGSKEEAALFSLVKKVHEREAKKAKPKEEKKA
jgi:ParB-like chromosome segregation protein Spo0J